MRQVGGSALPWSVAAAVALSLDAFQDVAAQGAAKKFDGRRIQNSIRCTPAGQHRWNGTTISNGAFNWTMRTESRSQTCTFRIAADGSFKNPECPFDLSGSIAGDRMTIKWKTAESICEVTGKRAP